MACLPTMTKHVRYLPLIFSALAALVITGACGAPAGPPPTPTPRGSAAKGKQVFATTCTACHGPDAKGLPNLGRNLHANEFVKGLSDDDLVKFIKTGRPASDPKNTSKVDMPPKGGNPAVKDSDLDDLVAFLRSLQ